MSASVFTKEDINLIKESWASLEASVRLRCESEEELKRILEMLQNAIAQVADLLSSATDTSSQIAQNIGQMA